MSGDPRADALVQNGWTEIPDAPGVYTHDARPGHTIDITLDGDGWHHMNGPDSLIGSAKYGRTLDEYLPALPPADDVKPETV